MEKSVSLKDTTIVDWTIPAWAKALGPDAIRKALDEWHKSGAPPPNCEAWVKSNVRWAMPNDILAALDRAASTIHQVSGRKRPSRNGTLNLILSQHRQAIEKDTTP